MFIPALGRTVAELTPRREERAQPPRTGRGRTQMVKLRAEAGTWLTDPSRTTCAPARCNWAALPPLSLYVHLPWCLRKCPYCDFNSHEAPAPPPGCPIGSARLARRRATSTRCAPTWSRAAAGLGPAVQSVFIGGGTPSLFSPEAIDRLLADIRARLPLEPGARSRWRPTPAPSSASASAPSAPRASPPVGRRAEL
jgi:hypothetical protein